MKSIKSLLTIICFLEVNSERWYSATVVDSEESIRLAKDRVTNYIQDEKFLPIGIRKADDNYPRNYSSWHFKKRKKYNNEWKPSMFGFKTVPNVNSVETRIKKIRKKCSKVPRISHARENKSRTRFLEVFEVVEFDHVSCTSSSGLEGSCLHEFECQTAGGTAMGSCADGYGTCCVSKLIHITLLLPNSHLPKLNNYTCLNKTIDLGGYV